jgi:hypothetical protein
MKHSTVHRQTTVDDRNRILETITNQQSAVQHKQRHTNEFCTFTTTAILTNDDDHTIHASNNHELIRPDVVRIESNFTFHF